MSVDAQLDTAALDSTVATLRENAPAWAALPLAEKIAMLDRLRPRILDESEDMVAAIQRAKGIDPSTTQTYAPAFCVMASRSAASACLPEAAITVSW